LPAINFFTVIINSICFHPSLIFAGKARSLTLNFFFIADAWAKKDGKFVTGNFFMGLADHSSKKTEKSFQGETRQLISLVHQ